MSNIAIGNQALYNNQTGSYNISIGDSTLAGSMNGQFNTVIGYNAGGFLTDGSNNIVIGANAVTSGPSAYNECVLGTSGMSYRYYTASGWLNVSDERDKKDIITLKKGLEFVEKLNPVSFVWDMRDGSFSGVPSNGFIAQELQQAQQVVGITIPGLVNNKNPENLEACYTALLPIMVKAIQELKAEIDDLKLQLQTNNNK